MPNGGLQHLVSLHLSIPWHRRWHICLQLRDEQQMHAWATDLQRRATEDSSQSELRRSIHRQAIAPDPSLAVGMLAVRKKMALAMTDAERASAAQGISSFRGVEHGGGAPISTTAKHAEHRSVRATEDDAQGADGRQNVRRTRIERALVRKRSAADGHELSAVKAFESVVMYTPRGVHGSANDLRHCYPVERQQHKSLAASAREAAHLNELADLADEEERSKAKIAHLGRIKARGGW